MGAALGDLTRNFSRYEFRCRGFEHGFACCGASAPVSLRLVRALQTLRSQLDRPLIINSGFRCLRWNSVPREEGGPGSNDNSQHCLGLAADVMVPAGLTADALGEAALLLPEFLMGGVGIYEVSGFVHLDIRGDGPAFWRET